VHDLKSLHSAILKAVQGDEIIMANSIWTDVEIVFEAKGEEGNLISLKAEEPGKVSIEGNSNLQVRTSTGSVSTSEDQSGLPGTRWEELVSKLQKVLGQDGSAVVLNGIEKEQGAIRIEELTAEGITADYYGFELTNENDVTSNINGIGEKYGKIDVLANNAGGFGGGGPRPAIYAASKGVIMTVTRSWAKELGPQGIRVNAVCSGMIATKFHDDFTKDEVRAKVASAAPLRREGGAEEVADLVCYLASEESSFMTGANVDINGGLAFS